MWNAEGDVFARMASSSKNNAQEDEEALRWAALERLPTYARVRRGIFKDLTGGAKEIGLSELEMQDQRLLLDRLVSSVDHDPRWFFERMRQRFEA